MIYPSYNLIVYNEYFMDGGRHLGPNSRLEIVKDAGHAANIDSPNSLTDLIIPFVLGTTTDSMDPLHTN